jgi:hypothetical protein
VRHRAPACSDTIMHRNRVRVGNVMMHGKALLGCVTGLPLHRSAMTGHRASGFPLTFPIYFVGYIRGSRIA